MPKAPYPPRFDGSTVRMNPIFEYLCKRHQVDAIVACDPRGLGQASADEARRHCQTLIEFGYSKMRTFPRRLRVLKGLLDLGRAPFRDLRVWAPELAKLVIDRDSQVNYDAILWFGMSDATSNFIRTRPHSKARVIMDWVDSPSLIFERDRRASNDGRLKLLAGHWLRRWKCWELSLNKRLDSAIYIAKTDAGYANSQQATNVHVLPNGLFDDLPPDLKNKTMEPKTTTIGFLGVMGYGPNIRAALRLYKIFTSLLPEIPSLKLKIIGRDPVAAITTLASSNVEVTGTVESIWPDVLDTDVFVFPMTIGSGLQNKVLEVLRAGKPVVTTEICASGLENKGQGAVLTAESDDDFRQTVLELLRSDELRQKCERNGLDFIKHYDWNVILPRYEQVLLPDSTTNEIS